MASTEHKSAIRGLALTFTGDAFALGIDKTMRYEPDAIVAMAGGKITHFGAANEVHAAAAWDRRSIR